MSHHDTEAEKAEKAEKAAAEKAEKAAAAERDKKAAADEKAAKSSAIPPQHVVPSEAASAKMPDKNYQVLIRHSPCPIKKLVVKAKNEAEAFAKFAEANSLKASQLAQEQRRKNPKFEPKIADDVALVLQNKEQFGVEIKEVA